MGNSARPWPLIDRWVEGLRQSLDFFKRASIQPVRWHGESMFIKRRHSNCKIIVDLCNWYFRRAHLPTEMARENTRWQTREVECFRRLNPGYEAFVVGEAKVCIEKIPGESLWNHARRGDLTRTMMVAAGREFRRAHGMWSAEVAGCWSHGDACLANVVFDPGTRRAHLIDFEMVHDVAMSARGRHAHDLLVLLLDLMIVPGERWYGLAMAFLKAYGDREVIGELRRKLCPFRGWGWVMWRVHTNFVKTSVVGDRLRRLCRAIDYGIVGAGAAELVGV